MKKKDKTTIIILTFVLVSLLGYYIINSIYDPKRNKGDIANDVENIPIRTTGVNEYSIANITDEQIALNYFNRFIQLIYQNSESAYNLLNEEYRIKRFNNINNFKEYINNLSSDNTEFPSIKSYTIERKTLTIVKVFDKNNNEYIFKCNGVMSCEIFLDENTTSID